MKPGWLVFFIELVVTLKVIAGLDIRNSYFRITNLISENQI
jgi:hypothetical protein